MPWLVAKSRTLRNATCTKRLPHACDSRLCMWPQDGTGSRQEDTSLMITENKITCRAGLR
jgi:hypothetical protein